MTDATLRGDSLRGRLLVAVLAAVGLAWAVAVAVSYFDVDRELDSLLDAHLAQAASLLIAQVSHELEELEPDALPEMQQLGVGVVFQVWAADGSLRLRSARAPKIPLAGANQGFADVALDGKLWRVFTVWDRSRRYRAQVAEEIAVRHRIAGTVVRNLLLPLVIALPILGGLIWIAVARGLRPLVVLSQQVAARDPDNLAVVEVVDPPIEVAPLVDGLNRLLRRVSASIDQERRFTAHAAHELRTPLAALQAQAQVALGATDDAERRHALEQVIHGCDRAARLVTQLLTLARLEPEGAAGRVSCLDLREPAKQIVADLAPQALERGIEVGLMAEERVDASVDGELIALLLRNLVDNAIRYSAAGTQVRVELSATPDGPLLRVVDQGRGVEPTDRDRLGERFFRVLGTGVPGSGLGLSIVKRIAELHGAHVTFDSGDDGRGFVVAIAFPPPARP